LTMPIVYGNTALVNGNTAYTQHKQYTSKI